LLAGDSTKLRAQNSKKNNYNQGKIERHLAYIEAKLAAYAQALSQVDNSAEREKITLAMARHLQRREQYRQLAEQLKSSGEEQIKAQAVQNGRYSCIGVVDSKSFKQIISNLVRV
jgi:nitrogenase subunit NifH